jgi:hypothetical protein
MARIDPATVMRRLLEDDDVHKQIAEASAGARGVYQRVRRQSAEKAVQDKAVYDRLRRAATGTTLAARHALGKPEPKPKRSRLPALAVLGATVAVVVWAAKRDADSRASAGPTAAPPPVAPG